MAVVTGSLLLAGTLTCIRANAADATKSPAHKVAKTTVSRHSATSTTAKSSTHRKGKKSRKSAGSWRRRGQQKIDSQRTREIQEALIREHYLDGEPSGQWDDTTQKALKRYQGDNGWQTKTTPDSRALIKLGLGPDHEHLLNPESAMTTAPASSRSNVTPASAITTAPTRTPADNQPQR